MAFFNQSPFSTSNLCFDPLTNTENVAVLRTLTKLVKTCIGPHGKLKIIRNSSGGHTSVTSSSQRLFHCISVKNLLAKLIISSARSQLKAFNDGGLQCAFLTLSLIEHSSSSEAPQPLISTLYEYFTNTYCDCLKSEVNHCVLRIDFSNLLPLRSLVVTFLSSKPGCLLTQSQKDYLCGLLLEAFLKILPSASAIMDNFNIRFLTLEGSDIKESKSYEGLLIKVTKIDWNLIPNFRYLSAKVVLFTISLAGDTDFPVQNIVTSGAVSVPKAVLKNLRNVILKLISEKVEFVFCQKVIHPNLKKQLNDAGIIVFDQLGCEIAGYLQYMLGGSANSSLFSELSFGTITCSKKEIEKSHYILLQTDSYSFHSVLLCSCNEESLTELKVVCQQITTSLFRLLRSCKVCYGAGCTEVFTAICLSKKIHNELHTIASKYGCTSNRILSVLQSFLSSIIELALTPHQGSRLDFVTETVHGHLWNINSGNYPGEEDTCACGRYTAASILPSNWHFLSELDQISDSFNFVSTENSEVLPTHLILDELDSKLNRFKLGGETSTLFLKTNLCIYSEASKS